MNSQTVHPSSGMYFLRHLDRHASVALKLWSVLLHGLSLKALERRPRMIVA